MSATVSHATVGAARIHYRVQGSGTPLALLLPQSSGPVGTEGFVEALAERHQVLIHDARGTGRSDPAPAGLTMDAMAGDLLGLLDALGIDRAHVVCHSTGCGTGIALAAAHGSRLASLALIAPWTHADPHLTTMQNLRKAAAAALDPYQYARFNAALLFPPEYRRGHEEGFARLAAAAREAPQDAAHIARRLDAILAFDARPLLAAVRCPTLVVTARDDQLMPPWLAAEAAAGIPGARLLALDGGGHMLPETRPDEVLDAVLAHLSTAGSRSAERSGTDTGGH